MARITIHDGFPCRWLVKWDGWGLLWGASVVEADDITGEVVLVHREGGDLRGNVVPLDQAPMADGCVWVRGQLVVCERRHGRVEFIEWTDLDQPAQEAQAWWQGWLDGANGKCNWGRAHFGLYRYDLLTHYDSGYRLGTTY